MVIALVSAAGGCSEGRIERGFMVTSPSLPVGIRLSDGERQCRFAHLAFSARIEMPESVDTVGIAEAAETCADRIFREIKIATLIDTPAGIAVSFGSRFGSCVVGVVGDEVRVLSAEAALVTEDWSGCG